MNESIPFARPFLGSEEEDAVLKVLRSGWLTTGEEALAFEREFAAFLEAGAAAAAKADAPLAALAVNSATSGLHLALEAGGAGQGDLVLVPSYTFSATAEVARYLGAEVVFVDVKPDSFSLDPAALEATVARLAQGKPAYGAKGPVGRPRAVIPVHFGGLPCDIEEIMRIAKRRELFVIEDAAHALPAPLPQGYAGTLAHAGVYSFYANKTMTTGEGGMVVTRDEALARRMTTMRLHGIDRPVWNRYSGEKASWRYEITGAGYKYNLPDVLAAIGRVQLRRLNDMRARRAEIAARYDAAFAGDERFLIPQGGGANAYHLYPLRLTERCAVARDEYIQRLQAAGIGVSVHFIPLHTMPYYRNRYGLEPEDFPHTMQSFEREISIPLWAGMTDAQIERVIKAVRDVS